MAAACEGPSTTMCPGSILQIHERATVIIDEAAAEGLRMVAYYKETSAGKPEWQRFE